MLVKCAYCEAHVPAEIAVEIPIGDGRDRFCSLRCAALAEAQATSQAPLSPLPAVPKRILVPVDGSGPSLRATEIAASLARVVGGSITLLHAIDSRWLRWFPTASGLVGEALGLSTEEMEQGLRKEAGAQFDRCQRVCEEAGVPVAWRIEVAPPLRAIIDAAADADLIVIGSRGLGAISGAAVGSLAHRVLGETRKPMLVVH